MGAPLTELEAEMLAALHRVGVSAGWQYLTMETRSVIEAAIAKAEARASELDPIIRDESSMLD